MDTPRLVFVAAFTVLALAWFAVLLDPPNRGAAFTRACQDVGGHATFAHEDWLGRESGGKCWVEGEMVGAQAGWEAGQ